MKKRNLNLIDLYKNSKLVNYLINTIINVIFGVSILIIYLLGNKFNLYFALNGLLLSFIILFSIGSLELIFNFGTFDAFNYSIVNKFYLFQKNGKKKYKDLIEYKEIKDFKRKKERLKFLPYYLASLIFLIAIIVVFIIYKLS